MAANVLPAFTKNGKIGGAALATTALTKSDGSSGATGIGTDMTLVFTADATNGSFIRFVRLLPTAVTAATGMTPTTLRVYTSTVTSGVTTAANTHPWAEVSGTAQTADHSTNATFAVDVPCNFWLPAGQTILVSQHVAPAANTAWKAVVFAGDY